MGKRAAIIIAIVLLSTQLGAEETVRIIEGTFLQFTSNDRTTTLNWTWDDWERELLFMKNIGMTTLIIQWVEFPDETAYHVLDEILLLCDEMDIDVYIGLYCPDYDNNLRNYKTKCVEIIGRIKQDCITHRSFEGWYLPLEFDHTIPLNNQNHVSVKNLVVDLIDECTRNVDKPVMISPFILPYRRDHSCCVNWPDPNGDFKRGWVGIIGKIAETGKTVIIAPQDVVGQHYAHYTPRYDLVNKVKEYFGIWKGICDRHSRIKFWANVEIFTQFTGTSPQEVRFEPANYDRVISQIEAVTPYVEKIICFEFNHYMSPVRNPEMCNPARDLYYDYYKEYICERYFIELTDTV
jgi:hypothetical protein